MSLVMANPAAVEHAVTRLIYRAALFLDAKDFKAWLDLSAPDFTYSITAYSFEIRKEMTWLRHGHEEMANLVKMLPRHNTDQSNFTRHTTVYQVDQNEDGSAQATSAVTIYRTTLDGGVTNIFAIGKYFDVIDTSGEQPRFRSRQLRLDTRALGIGTHYPL